jgi:hypothetical protein
MSGRVQLERSHQLISRGVSFKKKKKKKKLGIAAPVTIHVTQRIQVCLRVAVQFMSKTTRFILLNKALINFCASHPWIHLLNKPKFLATFIYCQGFITLFDQLLLQALHRSRSTNPF